MNYSQIENRKTANEIVQNGDAAAAVAAATGAAAAAVIATQSNSFPIAQRNPDGSSPKAAAGDSPLSTDGVPVINAPIAAVTATQPNPVPIAQRNPDGSSPRALAGDSLLSTDGLSTKSTPASLSGLGIVAVSVPATNVPQNDASLSTNSLKDTSLSTATAVAPLTFATPTSQPKLQELAPHVLEITDYINLLNNAKSIKEIEGYFSIQDSRRSLSYGESKKIATIEHTATDQVVFKGENLDKFLELFSKNCYREGRSRRIDIETECRNATNYTLEEKRKGLRHSFEYNACFKDLPQNNFILGTFDDIRAKKIPLDGAVVLWKEGTDENCTLQYSKDKDVNTIVFARQDFHKFLSLYGNYHYQLGDTEATCVVPVDPEYAAKVKAANC